MCLFFKLAKFELKEKYVIEFNEAALTMAQQGGFKGISAEEARIRSSVVLANTWRAAPVDNALRSQFWSFEILMGSMCLHGAPTSDLCEQCSHFRDPQFADEALADTYSDQGCRVINQGTAPGAGGDFNSEPKSSVHGLCKCLC